MFYTALSYTTPATIMRFPYSLTEAVVWTVLTYFVVGLAPDAGRYNSFPTLCATSSQCNFPSLVEQLKR